MINIEIRQGSSGRWRWLAYRNGKFVAIGRVRGNKTRDEAIRRAKQVFSESVNVPGEYGDEFAGERDFSD